MSFKKKVFGFVAAAALTLSMVGGAAAQAADNKVTGDAELKGSNLCGLTVNESTANFGEWTWNGTKYTLSGGDNVSVISTSIVTGQPGQTCDVSVASSGLFYQTGNPFSADTTSIPYSNFSIRITGGGWNDVVGGSHTFAGLDTSNPNVRLRLNEVPDHKPGNYEGTFGFTVSANNP